MTTATWAYFFSRDWDPMPGVEELYRVVRLGGPIVIVDNIGGDEFTALVTDDITADTAFWTTRGFRCTVLTSSFEFEDAEDARTLLGWYLGSRGADSGRTRLSFRVGVFHTTSKGPGLP